MKGQYKNSPVKIQKIDGKEDSISFKDTYQEERNDLFQNMFNQHELIQEYKDHSMLQGDSSIIQPSSLRCINDFKIIQSSNGIKLTSQQKSSQQQLKQLNTSNLDSSIQFDTCEFKKFPQKNTTTTGFTSYAQESTSQSQMLKNNNRLQNSSNQNNEILKDQSACMLTDMEFKSRNFSQILSDQSKLVKSQNNGNNKQNTKEEIVLESRSKIISNPSQEKEMAKISNKSSKKSKEKDCQSNDQLKSGVISIAEFEKSSVKNCLKNNEERKSIELTSFQKKISQFKFIDEPKKQNKKMTNFDRGIHIIIHIFKNQMNKMLRIQNKVVQFSQMLKIRYSKRNAQNLNSSDLHIINDKSYFLSNQLKQSSILSNSSNQSQDKQIILSNIPQQSFRVNRIEPFFGYTKVALKFLGFLFSTVSCNKKYKDLIPILMPTDKIVVVWDTLQICFTYIFLYVYSIHVFFAQTSPETTIEVFFYAIFFFITIDILVQFHIAYYEKDVIVSKYSKIAKKKIFSPLFLTDLITLLTILFKIHFQNTVGLTYNPNHDIKLYLLNSIIFLLINRLSEKRKRFLNIITLEENQKHLYRLFCQLFNVIQVAHIVCTAWYLIGLYEEEKGNPFNWLRKAQIENSGFQVKYIYSFYWAITTMTTVGYGDIAATNQFEAVFIAVTMIVFSCLFAYSINNIGFILQEIEKSSKQLNDQLTVIQRKNVNISLKSRVRHYLQFLAQEQKNRDKIAEDETINLLSNRLREEITEEINTRILNKFHLFSSNFSSKIMKQLVFLMKEVVVSPNEIIFEENDSDDSSIYFIQNGIIEIYVNQISIKNKTQTVLQSLSANCLFGEISFFSGLSRKACARSVNLSTLYKINRMEFIELLKSNEEDFERFKMLQEQIIQSGNFKCIYLQCYSCQQFGHIASSCPKITKFIDKQFVILKYNFSTFQERYQKFRRRNKSFCNRSKQILFSQLFISIFNNPRN